MLFMRTIRGKLSPMLEEYMAVCYLCAHFLLEEHLHELNIYSTGLVAFKIHCYLFLCMQVGGHKQEDPHSSAPPAGAPKEAYPPTSGQGCLPSQTFSKSIGLCN